MKQGAKYYRCLLLLILAVPVLTSCYFHFQQSKTLAQPLHKLYIQTADPYGSLERILKQLLKASKVTLVNSPAEASSILNIIQTINTSQLLSVSSTQQTRQYKLVVTVTYEITDRKGIVLVPAESISESRITTEQSNQILGSSNEASLFYLQMRQTLARAILNRLSSKQVNRLLTLPTDSNRL